MCEIVFLTKHAFLIGLAQFLSRFPMIGPPPTSSIVNHAGHLSFNSSPPDSFSMIPCLGSEKVVSILFSITARLFRFFTSLKSDSLSFSNLSGVSPVGLSGMWLASPLLGLFTFVWLAMHPLELWTLVNLQVIQSSRCPLAEFGCCPCLSSAAASTRSNRCTNQVQRSMDASGLVLRQRHWSQHLLG